MSSAKNWCFTLNNPEIDDNKLEFVLQQLASYYVFQLERGDSGTEHYQGYVQFSARKRLSALKKILPGAHWEVAKGNATQNTTYCSKEPRLSQTRIFGQMSTAGQRTDIEELRDRILEGKSDSELLEDHAVHVAKFPKFIHFVRNTLWHPRIKKPTVTCYYGPSGSGKTRKAFNFQGHDKTYMVSKPDNGRPLWWDGYDPTFHTTIILDDFYGWLPWSYILRLLDRYPFQVEIKGGKIHFNSPHIFLTSNQHPDKWYKNIPNDDLTPLLRRIDKIELIE